MFYTYKLAIDVWSIAYERGFESHFKGCFLTGRGLQNLNEDPVISFLDEVQSNASYTLRQIYNYL